MHAVAAAMQRKDAFILAAMDGLEAPATEASTSARKESTLFYPIILGLVFEALSQSTDVTSSPSNRLSSSVALKTLTWLVRPEYSGSTIFETSTFSELVALFYRMTLTEPADIQLALVRMIVSLATSRDAGDLQTCVWVIQHTSSRQ